MKPFLSFLRKHWLTLAILVGSIYGVNWVVSNKRPPGAMTVVEAQAMDMTTMKPPSGMMPVSVDIVAERSLEGGKSLPATISALTEEEIVARVGGRVTRILVYPGDKVVAGQLIATIEAPEADAGLRKSQAMAGAKASEVVSAEREIANNRNMLAGANAKIKGAETAIARARSDAEAALLELLKARDDLAGAQAMRFEQEADLKFAEQSFAREKELFTKGAISQEELQGSQRDRDTAAARVKAADAAIRSSAQMVKIAEKRAQSARQMISQAQSEAAMARSEAEQAKEGVSQAQAEASAKRFESSAAGAEAAGAYAVANYRQLRALSSGVVSERVVSPGTSVMAGQAVVRLRSVGKLRVQADAPQALAGMFDVGNLVQVVTDLGQQEAKITSVFPTVDSATRTFRVEAIIQNTDGKLKPGMFAHLEITGEGTPGLATRTVAIQHDGSGKFVWVVKQKADPGKSDWTCTMHLEISQTGPGQCPKCGMDLTPREKGGSSMAHRQPITVGRSGGDFTEVVAGLEHGDKVIWAGFEDLVEGMAVQVGDK